MSAYAEEYRRSLHDRDRFWLNAADAIEWTTIEDPAVLDGLRDLLTRRSR